MASPASLDEIHVTPIANVTGEICSQTYTKVIPPQSCLISTMNVLDICQEAVKKGFICPELAHKLNQVLWDRNLNSVELATLEFLSKRIEAGKIKVAPISFNHDQTSMQG